jgi:RHS repeat-associated protein
MFSMNLPTTPPATRYNLFDHLGSVTAITDEMGHVLGPPWGGADATMASYDAWGARRSFDGSAASPASFNLQVGHREFTGHEAVPNVGLVNMNGRVYDPELGRFLSPDPSVQFVADLQSYNRYTYAANNPLRYTDPTGYSRYSFLTSTSFWVGFGEASLAALACAGGPEACMGVGLFLAVANSSAALVQGAPPGQVALGLAMGLLAGQFGGAAGGEIGTGTSPWIIAGGALGGMLSGAMMTPVMGGSLGRNMLIGAASGAASAAITWSLQGTNPVSQASAAESQGGGGSGADQVAAANQEAATKGQPAEEEVREFGASARDSIARENYQFAIANMDAAGELGGPALGADGQPLRTAWTFEVTASVNINIGPVNINYSVGLAGDSNGGLAITRTGGGGAGVGSGGSAGVGWDVSNGASVDDLAGPFATTQTSAGLGPSASTSGYTGTGSQGQQIAGTGWSVGAGAGGGTYSGGSVTKVVRIW